MNTLRTVATALHGPVAPRATRPQPLSRGWCLRWNLMARALGPRGLTEEECWRVAVTLQERLTSRGLEGRAEVTPERSFSPKTLPDVVVNLTGDLPDEETQQTLTQDLREILTDIYVSRP